MKRVSKLILTVLIPILFSMFHLAQNDAGDTKGNAASRGLEIVFVVDVSGSMQGHLGCVKEFISQIYKKFNDPGKNNFHLITFSDCASYFSPVKNYDTAEPIIDNEKEKTRKELDNDNSHKRKNTYPKHGLWEVLNLIETNFIQKVGVVIFFSDGEDNRNEPKTKKLQKDMKMPIRALKNIGFTVFPIFVDTGKDYECQKCMYEMKRLADTTLYEIGSGSEFAKIAEDLKKDIIKYASYNSPKLYRDIIKAEKEWKKKVENQQKTIQNLQVAKKNLEEEIVKLEEHLMVEEIRSLTHEILSIYFASKNEKYKSGNKWLSIILVIFAVVFIISGFIGFRAYIKQKKNQDVLTTPGNEGDRDGEHEKSLPGETPEEPKPPLETPWGKLVDMDNKEEFDLRDEKKRESISKNLGIKLSVENRDNKKVISLRQEKGTNVFLDKDYKPCKNNCGYIDEDTRFFILKGCGNDQDKMFAYHFLDKLVDSFDKPVLDKEKFIGREKELKAIKDNFLQKRGIHHILISGMSNSGKTSLMHYLHKHFFPNDRNLSAQYISKLIEFEPGKYENFSYLEDQIEEELRSIPSGDTRKRLILIDEYDKVFDEFPDEFGDFIKNTRFSTDKPKQYLVLAGQRGWELLPPQHETYLSEYTLSIVLSGLDDFISSLDDFCAIPGVPDKVNSIDLIDTLLADIRFPKDYLPYGIKENIIKFSSGFPYFTKRILHRLLIEWLRDYGMNPISKDNVDHVVRNIIREGEIYTAERAINYDKEYYKDDLDNVNQVPIVDIIFILRKEINDDGKIKKEVFKKRMIDYPTGKEKVLHTRKEIFNKKIDQLIDMGLILKEGKYLIPVPYMFFSPQFWES